MFETFQALRDRLKSVDRWGAMELAVFLNRLVQKQSFVCSVVVAEQIGGRLLEWLVMG